MRGAHNKSPCLAWPVGRHFGRFSSWGLGRHHHSLSPASFSSGWVRDLLHWGCSHEEQRSGDDSLATGAQRSESLLLLPWGVCFESFLLLLLENPIKIQRLAKLGIFFAKAQRAVCILYVSQLMSSPLLYGSSEGRFLFSFFIVIKKGKSLSTEHLRHSAHVKGCQSMWSVITASYFTAEVAL